MIVYGLHPPVCALMFDIDNTLYRNDFYVTRQVDLLVGRFAELRRISLDSAAEQIERARTAVAHRMGQESTSIGNAMTELGISLAENAKWRTELFRPGEFLEADDRLITVLDELTARIVLVAATNNSTAVGEKTLEALGVREYFCDVIGLDRVGESKPSPKLFIMAVESAHVSAFRAVSVGDRYFADIAPALQCGLGGILVESMEDVYSLEGVVG